jgi:hypothetical protein
VSTAAGCIAAALAAAALGSVTATATAATERAEFVTAYIRPATADYRLYQDDLQHERFLESVADELNRALELPARVTLRLAECGHSTTRWEAGERAVTVCYEFLDAVLSITSDAGFTGERAEQLFAGAVTFALFAEVGRALSELYGLPAPRGAERAGDEFAAVTLAAADRDGDANAAAAVEFYDLALKQPESGFEYLETHGFDRPRLETVACVVYGNAPAHHAALLDAGLVPAARAPRCAEELVALAQFWEGALRDHSRAPPATAVRR